jgi:septal ring factor EnvC (AmiA/AmiB activator)
MRRSSLITSLYLALLFLSGVAVGAFGLRLYTLNSVRVGGRPSAEEFKRRYIAELRSRLNLTDDQMSKLGPILDETRKQIRELRDKHRPELKAIQDEQSQRIRALLTDSQQAEYTKFLDEREKQRERAPHP